MSNALVKLLQSVQHLNDTIYLRSISLHQYRDLMNTTIMILSEIKQNYYDKVTR